MATRNRAPDVAHCGRISAEELLIENVIWIVGSFLINLTCFEIIIHAWLLISFMTIDINCDMGEGMPDDEWLMPYVSSANIACGGHAGDGTTMRQSIALCQQHGVAIGV